MIVNHTKPAKRRQALVSNACESESLVHDASVTGEYIDYLPPAKSADHKVEPLARAALRDAKTTMTDLHRMAVHDLDVLDALRNKGRQIIKTRLMAIWEEMAARFERGESVNGISGTGGKGMGKYLRSIRVDPAKRRSWKFEIHRKAALQLAREIPPIKTKTAKDPKPFENEAELLAKAGVRLAETLAGEGMTPPQERAKKAEEMAKDILEAVSVGGYAGLEPLPDPRDEQQKLTQSIHTPHALWTELNNSGWIDAFDNVFMVDSEADFAARVQEFAQYIADEFRKGFKVAVHFNGKEEGGE
jgi:hypothetical protein